MSDLTSETTIVKRGETVLQFTLSRHQIGLAMRVKAHPLIEDFIRSMSGPEVSTLDVKASGRHWHPLMFDSKEVDGKLVKVPKVLTAYRFTSTPAKEQGFTLDYLGSPLIINPAEDGPRTPLVNLSWLRLVGISEGLGITFGVKGVQSYDAMVIMKDQIAEGMKVFYTKYLKPADLTVTIATQEAP